MPVTKAAEKALRQNAKRKIGNKKIKREVLESIKSFRKKINSSQVEEARKMLPEIYKKIDKATKKGIVHKNKASRRKSRLSKKLSSPTDES